MVDIFVLTFLCHTVCDSFCYALSENTKLYSYFVFDINIIQLIHLDSRSYFLLFYLQGKIFLNVVFRFDGKLAEMLDNHYVLSETQMDSRLQRE